MDTDILSRFTDPLAGSAWSAPRTVAGFAQSLPNAVLMTFAEHELRGGGHRRALDVGCGAGRSAVPSHGSDGMSPASTSWPMLGAAVQRVRDDHLADRLAWCSRPWTCSRSATAAAISWSRTASDLALGWPVSTLGSRGGPRDIPAERCSCSRSRHHHPAGCGTGRRRAVRVHRVLSQPQCFLTEAQLVSEMGAAGFVREPVALKEYAAGDRALAMGAPVIERLSARRVTASSASARSTGLSEGSSQSVDYHGGLHQAASGRRATSTITCSVRIWMRPHVTVGGRYPMEEGEIEVDSIQPISFADITPDLARRSSFLGVVDLLKTAKRSRRERLSDRIHRAAAPRHRHGPQLRGSPFFQPFAAAALSMSTVRRRPARAFAAERGRT